MYQFDESLEGCEDYDWCQEMLARGYNIIYDPSFDVYHSHGGIGRSIITDRFEEWNKIKIIVDSKIRPSNPNYEINKSKKLTN